MTMPIRLTALATIIAALWLLTACKALDTLIAKDRVELLEPTIRLFAVHMRWGRYQEAASMLQPGTRWEIARKINPYPNIRITEVISNRWIISPDESKATGDVRISYYKESSGIVRTVVQQQTWIYNEQNRQWYLDNDLPDLR
ncbi:MAG: hypothetical protein BMS9Abin15_0281 [Gammaproteobacteria bacterium]|nr:MAG: hypothetical protein BMS9Abin15_0281 [Gammaproteobacteria bacterium]